SVSAQVGDRASALTEVLRALDADGVGVVDVALRRPTLDEVFLQLTGVSSASRTGMEVTA
ncbi:daunorubicin/doxorubicin resistance ABC transporter ATP-binding protein DrrA, partial [Micromonospora sp. NPDC005313]